MALCLCSLGIESLVSHVRTHYSSCEVSKPQFPHLWNGSKNNAYFLRLWEVNELIPIEQDLPYNKSLIILSYELLLYMRFSLQGNSLLLFLHQQKFYSSFNSYCSITSAFKPSPASAGFLCAPVVLLAISVAAGITLNCHPASYMPALLCDYNSQQAGASSRSMIT